MIVLRARVTKQNCENFAKWKMVNDIIMANLTEDMKDKWVSDGYEGLFSTVPEYFKMTKMYRSNSTHVTFEFTDKQYLMFLLRWA